MKSTERATQIWPLLCFAASNRQTITYERLSRLIAVLRPGLGQLLEPIQAYCLLKKLPALTSLVVRDESGLPGEGFFAASDIPGAHARVFSYDWSSVGCPSHEEFQHAVEESRK
jgi:putative restriction endonuclease